MHAIRISNDLFEGEQKIRVTNALYTFLVIKEIRKERARNLFPVNTSISLTFRLKLLNSNEVSNLVIYVTRQSKHNSCVGAARKVSPD